MFGIFCAHGQDTNSQLSRDSGSVDKKEKNILRLDEAGTFTLAGINLCGLETEWSSYCENIRYCKPLIKQYYAVELMITLEHITGALIESSVQLQRAVRTIS